MNAYSIPAIPTVYRGRQYRSRLEAKWAAFFDLLGWRHEYEPFDLGSWSPDFRIVTELGTTFLVEVKPIDAFSESVGDKMKSAAFDVAGFRGFCLLLVGSCPEEERRNQGGANYSAARLGWMLLESGQPPGWNNFDLLWCQWRNEKQLRPVGSLCHYDDVGAWHGADMTNDHSVRGAPVKNFGEPHRSMELWSRASNEVQWKPGRKRRPRA